MRTLVRGMAAGAGYGLAVACVESGLFVVRLAQMNLPAMSPPAQAALLQVLLGAGLGALLAPLLHLRGGWLWHLAVLSAGWLALADAAAPESAFLLPVVAGPPLAGLALAIPGRFAARWRPWLPAALGIAALLGLAGFSEVRRRAESAPPADVAARPPPAPGTPDVVVVVLDTVRAESLSAYGYGRETSPHFDALARGGALFLEATAPATWSLPSHASLFTGHFASAHGAHSEHHYLRQDLPTLAETLAAAGFETACFTSNPWISDALGTARGFDHRDEAWRRAGAGRNMNSAFRLLDFLGFGGTDKGGREVVGHFEDWLARRPASARPAFAFLNFVEAHFPYHQLPDEFLLRFSDRSRRELRELSMQLLADQFGDSELDPAAAAQPARDMYDAGILYADHLLGRVAGALRRRGTLDETILVVLSDHGELLGEHGAYGHGRSLFEPTTRVPLLVRYPPRIAPARVATPVSTVGAMATILALLQVEPAGPLHVGSLLPALEGRGGGAPVLAERFADEQPADRESPLLREDLRHRSYRSGPLKLIETSAGERFLFDLAADPGETRDLAAVRAADLARLAGELERWRGALGLPALDAPLGAGDPPPELDAETRERLRALGYAE